MNLLSEITTNFQEWHCRSFDDGTTMHFREFSGNIHHQIRSNLHSAYNLFSQENRTIVVSCFITYTNIAIFTEV
ncbi:MAG: hypothetical protein ACFCU7_11620 [Pleurocapsa sp.]